MQTSLQDCVILILWQQSLLILEPDALPAKSKAARHGCSSVVAPVEPVARFEILSSSLFEKTEQLALLTVKLSHINGERGLLDLEGSWTGAAASMKLPQP